VVEGSRTGEVWSNVQASTPTFIGQPFDLVYPPESLY
jgi:hypothetical protein